MVVVVVQDEYVELKAHTNHKSRFKSR